MTRRATIVGAASAAVLVLLVPCVAHAGLTGGGGGPFVGPLVLRSNDTDTGVGGLARGPSGVLFGVGGMGYAEFDRFRIGGFGVGSSTSDKGNGYRSALGFGGVMLDLLLRPADRFVAPLGLIVGAGGYVVKDMSSVSATTDRMMRDSGTAWDQARTVYDTPFFLVGPKVGFATEVIPWMRIEGSAAFLAMFRDQGTSYAFFLSIGPTFGKFDIRPPNPACEDDYPGCRDRYLYPAAPRAKKRPAPPEPREDADQDEASD